MALTKDDLKAIKGVIEETVQPMIDGVKVDIRNLATDTAAGFTEVHEKTDSVDKKLSDKIDSVDDHVGRVERIVTAEVKRTDEQSGAIKRIRKQLRAV